MPFFSINIQYLIGCEAGDSKGDVVERNGKMVYTVVRTDQTYNSGVTNITL